MSGSGKLGISGSGEHALLPTVLDELQAEHAFARRRGRGRGKLTATMVEALWFFSMVGPLLRSSTQRPCQRQGKGSRISQITH